MRMEPIPPVSEGAAPRLSVVVPCYDEEPVLALLEARLTAACTAEVGDDYEIILVNDGSRDRTWQVICALADRNPRVLGVDLSRNHGHQLAVTAGLQVSRGALVMMIDADLQDPPELLGRMIERIEAGADVVYGQRVVRHGESPFKRGTASVFYKLLNRLSDQAIPVDTGDFRLMTRRVVDQLNAMPERFRFIRGMVSWIGFEQVALPYERQARAAGETHYPLRRMMRLAFDAITSFSTLPLRMASHLGVLTGFAGLAMLCWAVWRWFEEGTIVGWTSTIAVMLIMGSIQLIILGVFGDYLGRLYIESKRRPLFIVREVRGRQGRGAPAESQADLHRA